MSRFPVLIAVAILATARGPVAAACTGDCGEDGKVTINEVIRGVSIALGGLPLADCRALDANHSGSIAISELVAAVSAALSGCPIVSTPTPTATGGPTATAPPLDCGIPGVICTVAGTGQAQYDGDGRPALATSFYFPLDIEFDADGRPLILDWNNLLLRRIDRDGTVSRVMGKPSIEDFPTDGALAIDTPLHHASDVEFDAAGNLYVAGDHVPVVFRVNTEDRVYTVAGTEAVGYAGDGGPALAAELTTPFGVAPDGAGGYYISDVDVHVVRYVDATGKISTAAGTAVSDGFGGWLPGYEGDGGPATQARLAGPGHLRFGPDGALYICETRNHVIRRLMPDGTIDTFAGTGERGYSGDHGPATAARFDGPRDARFAPNGDLYVADTGNNVIRRIATDGTVTTIAGTGEPDFSGDGGPATAASLRRASAIAFDADGSLWIADTSNHRIRRVWRLLDTIPAP